MEVRREKAEHVQKLSRLGLQFSKQKEPWLTLHSAVGVSRSPSTDICFSRSYLKVPAATGGAVERRGSGPRLTALHLVHQAGAQAVQLAVQGTW